MIIETLTSPNPRNRNSISVVKWKLLSISSMNTLLAIFKVTDARRDVILAGGLYHRFPFQISCAFHHRCSNLLTAWFAGFYVGGKTSNIAFHFVLQERCKTSCTFSVAHFPVPLEMIIANEESSFTSYPTRARGIIVSYFIFPRNCSVMLHWGVFNK